MDLNSLLIFMVLYSCVATIWRSYRISRSFTSGRAWAIEACGLLVVLLIAGLFDPGAAGLIAGVPWMILILLPALLLRLCNRLGHEHTAWMRRIAIVAAFVHPWDGYKEQPEILRATELARKGEFSQAEEILNRYRDGNSTAAGSAIVTLYRIGCRWDEALNWFATHDPDTVARRDPWLIAVYLRALGEVGRTEELLIDLARFEIPLRQSRSLDIARLFALSFAGRSEALQVLFDGPLKVLSPAIRDFWFATADLSAGRVERGRATLSALLEGADLGLRRAAKWRLGHPLPKTEGALGPAAQTILDGLMASIVHDRAHAAVEAPKPQGSPATYLLIAANVAYFCLEAARGGTENLETLYNLGAMVPSACLHGQWWRLLSSCFLHMGPLHLLMNMIGLYYLGPFVEKSLGWARYGVAYLAAGVGAGAITVWLTAQGLLREALYVGASGAIMGLVGLTGAIVLRGWIRDRAPVARRRMTQIVGIVLLQALFDQMNPNISGTTHLAGAAVGFALGLALTARVGVPAADSSRARRA